ncbi:type III-B CRISPR module RAMP protein Cmr4 [Arthrospira platensis]|uniref:type III-B CRISPR module RAMP protein Cmr4 n=2 Tax=Oscillatoriales TaxID=1150 RepID=UPI0001C38CB4|nr:type III-B CRISPR module RAMP protein Cmr4 [Arthrospira platensis]AMW30296.1 type III-B CRISPR module RAMP protein Cmr4 [Arthrospira platensis YZ]KDR58286.1 CRISPR-associated protein Cmr4 [Arthrospira platensis str. Paraca]MBD2669278.1 type III-B CRISPR module RAMP protein Cmr4 [Arthrospira platensis FACHB-439]MBD2711605.1 type III-B CRISPR module RAMP protein Cmr4 [Arthrospira platensis FACHB-835]MDF2207782.1 type III-B CRISPR module RAMP protein Cmr4 [Arthrospira platensis NCB002]MDT9184
MSEFLTYLHLLTPLHTGGSANEGNLMGIAREVHTEFPYLPASSLRGKIRASLETEDNAGIFFGQKIEKGKQPTEGEVWFADASMLFFPIASLSHHLIWITCPLWLRRWHQWVQINSINDIIKQCQQLSPTQPALVSFKPETLFLQTALIKPENLSQFDGSFLTSLLSSTWGDNSLSLLLKKLVILSDQDCAALVETGLQREVRVALSEESKTVKGGSFRAEEAVPPETMLFFPWGMKPAKQTESGEESTEKVREKLRALLNGRIQFGGLEGIGRGWTQAKTISIINEIGGD